eukprot:m.276073 g.276073  ORF g.276073 m.276073 type:complete len:72 (+) comp79040_c0_seq1:350-565(+)
MTTAELENAHLLVFANKQDLPGALSPDQLIDKLKLQDLNKKRKWFVQPCSGKRKEGLHEGLDWLSKEIKKR